MWLVGCLILEGMVPSQLNLRQVNVMRAKAQQGWSSLSNNAVMNFFDLIESYTTHITTNFTLPSGLTSNIAM